MEMTTQHTESSWQALIQNTESVHGYKLMSVLGEGRFGIVYKAQRISDKYFVAIKFLKVWSVPDHAQANLIKRFELEFETGQIASQYLIRSIEMNQLEGIPYFVMEFCSGGNLERKIDSGISLAESLDVAEKILTGLQDLHMNGKIHRDLKPENVLFDSAGNPKLTDFGISGHINIQLTVVNNEGKPEQIFGSYAYMAPEQLSPVKRKNTLLPTIDIFSFGVLCYEMISSKLPFGPWETHDDIDPYVRKASKGDFVPFESSLKLDPTWKKIIAKCLSSDREKRYQNVGEVRMDLKGQHFSNDNMPCTSDFKLRILDGEEYGKLYEVALERTICLGRRSSSVKNEVVLEETISNYISRRHATFERIGNGIFIRDGQWNNKIQTWVTSKNGTYVNGILIGSLAGHHLHRNDIITVGNTSIKIY